MKNYDEDVEKQEKSIFYNAEMINVYWETKREIIEVMLPPGLKPAPIPLVNAFIINYSETNDYPAYKEAGIFVLAEKDGTLGEFCISMQMTSHEAMKNKKKIGKSPKKIAKIEMNCNDDELSGSITRNGITFFRVDAEIDDLLNAKDGKEILNKCSVQHLPMFDVKCSNSLDKNDFDMPPALIKQCIDLKSNLTKYSICHVQMENSPNDPWSALEVVNLIGGIYTVGNIEVEKEEEICKLNPQEFIPYSYTRCDWWL